MKAEIVEQLSKVYYVQSRPDISKHILAGDNRVLDVGCAAGYFGEYLKQHGLASRVVGIEYDPKAADEARTKLDQVYCVDLNRTAAKEALGNDTAFEYVICADVLEHLVDPWQTLSDLTAYLAKGGTVIASFPNVRHWSVWLPLILKGKWEYQDVGILDRTHLRFFTKASLHELFDKAGLEVISVHPTVMGRRWKLIDKLFLHSLVGIFAFQWVLLGRAKSGTT